MNEDELAVAFRDRLRDRAVDQQNSNLWNFKRYYAAASFWNLVDQGTAVLTAFMGAVLTYGLAWRTLPLPVMVALSLLVGTISLVKAIQKPGQRAEKLHAVGRRYQKLHDDIRDFIELDLKDSQREKEWLRDRFDELADRRHELKGEASLSGVWYRWISWRRGDRIYEEAATTVDERQLLDPNGFGDEGSGGNK